jgi:hypothetical protein
MKAKDGKFYKPGFIEMAKLWTGEDSYLIPIAHDIGDECEASLGVVEDRCDLGQKIEDCVHAGLKSRNIDVDLL